MDPNKLYTVIVVADGTEQDLPADQAFQGVDDSIYFLKNPALDRADYREWSGGGGAIEPREAKKP